MVEKPAESPRRKWLEPVVAALMALTTLGTAAVRFCRHPMLLMPAA
jgi:hypothetical protein